MRPDTFAIRLLPSTDRSPDDEPLGEICVGSFIERFAIYPFLGDAEMMALRWSEALRALLSGAAAVGLPTACNMTWVLYRSGSQVFVQQMLMLPGIGPQLLADGTVGDIPPHHEISEEGQRISQWATTLDAVSAFVAASSRS